MQFAIDTGDTSKLAPGQRGSKSQTDKIEEAHPGYIRELFRYAQRTLGCTATFQELTNLMNEKSDAPGEARMTISLKEEVVRRWFVRQKGKEKAPTTKPRLTDDHKRDRIIWARKWIKMLKAYAPFVFIDEKWFYTTSNRRKIKFLPPTAGELEVDKKLALPKRSKVVSRRYSNKVMCIGAVACPRQEFNFDGKIFLKQIAEEIPRTQVMLNFSGLLTMLC